MEIIKIKHIPACVEIGLIVYGIFVFLISTAIKQKAVQDNGDLIIGIICILLFFVFLILAGTVRTTVKFGEGSIIKCQWLFLFWKIDLDKFNAVTYKLVSNRTRGGGTYYSLQMMFYVDADHFKCLSEGLEQHIAEACIRRNFDRTELIKLYRYIEQNYPDKAKGFE